MNAMEDKMENHESQVGVCDGRKGEGMIQYADERQSLMTANENQIVVYQPSDTVRLDVRFENRTVWLSQKQMAVLFGCSSENIIVHLKKIYREEELSEAATAKENLVVQTEGNRTVSRKIKFYNLDAKYGRSNSVLAGAQKSLGRCRGIYKMNSQTWADGRRAILCT